METSQQNSPLPGQPSVTRAAKEDPSFVAPAPKEDQSSVALAKEDQPSFPRSPGETPRAFSAFLAFFNLGHSRSLQAVADHLDEKLDTVKKWSSRFRWSDRIQSFNSRLLQRRAEAEAALRAQEAADWARRTKSYREEEWEISQKLLGAVKCFLESFGDTDVEKMTLASVSRALQISSRISRQALSGTAVPEGPVLVPLQVELAAALKKAYSNPPAEAGPASPPPANPNTTKN
jgi:hypothetical protein